MYASKHRGRRDGVGSSWSRSSGSFGGSEPASLDGPPWQRVHPKPMEPSRRDRESAITMPFGKNPDPKGIAGTATRTREAKTTTLREKKLPSKKPPRPRSATGAGDIDEAQGAPTHASRRDGARALHRRLSRALPLLGNAEEVPGETQVDQERGKEGQVASRS